MISSILKFSIIFFVSCDYVTCDCDRCHTSITVFDLCNHYMQHYTLIVRFSQLVIFQTPKHVRDMFNFNTTSNPCGYLVLFVSKTPSVVWYFIIDLISPKVHGYFTLFESKSAVIFICIHCLIISFKLRKFTQNLHGVFPSPNLNSYIVFH